MCPNAKDKFKQHFVCESHYARPSLLWALSVCRQRLASPHSFWFSAGPDGDFFSFCKALKTERKLSGRLCKIIQALDVTEDGLKFFPISHCLKDELNGSLAWVAPAGCR